MVIESFLMKGRMQKTSAFANDCPQRDRTESERYGGVQTFMWMTEDNIVEVPFRMVQQAINQVLTIIYEPQFSKSSFGFRPRRGYLNALREVRKTVGEGYKYVVDLDLERFFDTVNHSKLIEILSRTIKDGRVVSLIHNYLRSGMIDKGLWHASEEGTPQGGPLSPLLSNIMLNELDKELVRRGHPFVRCADDAMIFCKSKRAADRVRTSITKYIEGQLFLKVNKEKTVVYI